MSPPDVILIAAFMCIAAIVAWVWIAERLDPPQRGRLSADEKPPPDLDAPTPGPVGTGWLEALPDDDPADATGVLPAATCYLGMPSEQYVDELFQKYTEAKQ